MAAEVNAELTAWSNVRLAASGMCCEDIVTGIMEGEVMKVFTERLTGRPCKRIGSLNNLTENQKITRVDWFLDILKSEDLIPPISISSFYFARHSNTHVLPVFWNLIRKDIIFIYEIAPILQSFSSSAMKTILSEPIPYHRGPFELGNTANKFKPYYTSSLSGRTLSYYNSKRVGEARAKGPETSLIDLVNSQLEIIPEGRRLEFEDFEDLTDSKILCCLINSFIPGTFTSEVLLNDRWTIDLVLQVASKLFRVNTKLTSRDIKEGSSIGSCAVIVYLFMCGYQLKQAMTVIKRLVELRAEKDKINHKMKRIESIDTIPSEQFISTSSPKKEDSQDADLQVALDVIEDELSWLRKTYNIAECEKWVEHVKEVQAETRVIIMDQMKRRFDVVTVPYSSMTINDLCESMVINLSLSNGNGFYASDVKETLWPNRKLVVVKNVTGEFYDDFTGAECPKGSIRGLLGVHLTDIIEIADYDFKDYTLYFESTSRNRLLKKGTRFLYQVFPGTPDQCKRLLRKSARLGNIEMIKKLVDFFKSDKEFLDSVDECGNTSLHLAARSGHLKSTHYLLEEGSSINLQNKSGGTPFLVSVEGLHKEISQLLIEWNADIYKRNLQNKTALEIVRNEDLKKFLEEKYMEQRETVKRISVDKDVQFLLSKIEGHISGAKPLISLASRCVNGLTLLHCAVKLGSMDAIKSLLSEHIDINVTSSTGATPLHCARVPRVIGLLLDSDASVNAVDDRGNTPLHCVCLDEEGSEAMEKNIQLLLSFSSNILAENIDRLTPVHCAASRGHITALKLLFCKEQSITSSSITGERNLVYLALKNGHLACAEWLVGKGLEIEEEQLISMCHSLFNDNEGYYKAPLDIFKFLLDNGLNVNTTFNNGKSLLHHSASLIHLPELTDLLILGGADISAQDKARMTPLFHACQVDNFYAASKLLKHGADCSCTDTYGKRPFDYIKDHEEWMYSGYFPDNIRAQLKAYSLKHAQLLVKSITEKLKLRSLK